MSSHHYDIDLTLKRTIMLSSCTARRAGFVAFRSLRSISSESDFVTVSIEETRETTKEALKKIGWDDEDVSLQAEIMTAAELCGNNQGLVKMYQPEMMAPAPDAGKPIIERETLTSAVVNGNQAPGMLAAVTAADLAVSKIESSKLPISIVSAYNTSTSSGQELESV